MPPRHTFNDVLLHSVVIVVDEIESFFSDVNVSGHSIVLHTGGENAVLRPNVKLPLVNADYSRKDHTRVNTDAHVYVDVFYLANVTLRYRKGFCKRHF